MQRSGDGDGLTVKLTGLELPAFRAAHLTETSSTVDTFNFYADAAETRLVATVVVTYTDATKELANDWKRTL